MNMNDTLEESLHKLHKLKALKTPALLLQRPALDPAPVADPRLRTPQSPPASTSTSANARVCPTVDLS